MRGKGPRAPQATAAKPKGPSSPVHGRKVSLSGDAMKKASTGDAKKVSSSGGDGEGHGALPSRLSSSSEGFRRKKRTHPATHAATDTHAPPRRPGITSPVAPLRLATNALPPRRVAARRAMNSPRSNAHGVHGATPPPSPRRTGSAPASPRSPRRRKEKVRVETPPPPPPTEAPRTSVNAEPVTNPNSTVLYVLGTENHVDPTATIPMPTLRNLTDASTSPSLHPRPRATPTATPEMHPRKRTSPVSEALPRQRSMPETPDTLPRRRSTPTSPVLKLNEGESSGEGRAGDREGRGDDDRQRKFSLGSSSVASSVRRLSLEEELQAAVSLARRLSEDHATRSPQLLSPSWRPTAAAANDVPFLSLTATDGNFSELIVAGSPGHPPPSFEADVKGRKKASGKRRLVRPTKRRLGLVYSHPTPRRRKRVTQQLQTVARAAQIFLDGVGCVKMGREDVVRVVPTILSLADDLLSSPVTSPSDLRRLRQEIASLRNKADRLRRERDDAAAEVAALQAEMANLEDDRESAEAELAALREAASALQIIGATTSQPTPASQVHTPPAPLAVTPQQSLLGVETLNETQGTPLWEAWASIMARTHKPHDLDAMCPNCNEPIKDSRWCPASGLRHRTEAEKEVEILRRRLSAIARDELARGFISDGSFIWHSDGESPEPSPRKLSAKASKLMETLSSPDMRARVSSPISPHDDDMDWGSHSRSGKHQRKEDSNLNATLPLTAVTESESDGSPLITSTNGDDQSGFGGLRRAQKGGLLGAAAIKMPEEGGDDDSDDSSVHSAKTDPADPSPLLTSPAPLTRAPTMCQDPPKLSRAPTVAMGEKPLTRAPTVCVGTSGLSRKSTVAQRLQRAPTIAQPRPSELQLVEPSFDPSPHSSTTTSPGGNNASFASPSATYSVNDADDEASPASLHLSTGQRHYSIWSNDSK